MAKVKSARRVAEAEARRKERPPREVQESPAVVPMFFGLLLAFVGGAMAMLAWDSSRIPLALLGSRWEEAAAWTTRLAVGVPSWAWTMVLFLASAAVAFCWMVTPVRRKLVVGWGGGLVAVAMIFVLAHGLFQQVELDQLADPERAGMVVPEGALGEPARPEPGSGSEPGSAAGEGDGGDPPTSP